MTYKEPESHPLEWLLGGDLELLNSEIPEYKDLKVKVITPLEIKENIENPTDDNIKEYFKLKDSSYLNIFYTGENCKPGNIFNFCCEDYLDRFEEVDLRLGFDRGGHKNYMRYPLWVLYYDPRWGNIVAGKSYQNPSVSHVASHSANGIRDLVCDQIEKMGIHIDQYGQFRHNNDLLWNSGDDKLAVISTSTFNICCENYSESGYITEKIFEALGAGCIPIYWGDNDLEPIINKDKVLIIDPKNPDSFKTLEELLQDNSLLSTLKSLPPFTDDIKKCVNRYKTDFLRMFKKIYNKKFGIKV